VKVMVSFVETAILGLIQGLTEWLPVSSSGHLAIVREFFGWQSSVFLYVLLHLGTLAVVVIFFRKDILGILQAIVKRDFESKEGRLGLFIVVGSVPTGVIGFVFKGLFETFFDNMLVVGLALLVTGFLLYFSGRRESKKALTYMDSFLVGIAQGIAIIPGISRSGATIATGLLRGVERGQAFMFSFLLSIPAIIGAAFAESGGPPLLVSGADTAAVVVGVATSMAVGYLSLKALQKILLKGKFHWFAPYCWAAGALLLVSQFL
jgi:undecaprenyl-diphosphatase